MRYFVQIVDSGSITRAAALSGVAQPALSQQLAVLENELKVKLLERSVAGVSLTPAGRVLYVRAQSILRQFDELREAVHREVKPLSGTVVLGISPTMLSRFGLTLIERVCTQHPEMHLQIREEGSVVLNELLANGKIELSISPTRPDGEVIVGEEVLSEPLVLTCPGVWDLREDASLEELAALPWVVPQRPNSIRTLVEAVFASCNLTPRVVVEIDSLHSALETVRRGLCAAAMPIGVIRDELEQGIVKARHLGDTPVMRPMYLAHRRSPALTPAAQFVRDILRDLATEWRLEASAAAQTPLNGADRRAAPARRANRS